MDLTVLPPSSATTVDVFKCEGDNQEVFTEQSIITLVSVYGCDSVVQTNLTTFPERILTIVDTSICAGEALEGYTMNGSYIDLFQSIVGCDSIRVLNLRILDQDNVLCQTTNTKEISKTNDFTISPNPTSEVIKITFDNFNFLGHKMRLFSPNGDLLLEESLNSYIKIINVQGLPGGVYLLVIDAVDVRYIERIVKL